MAEANEAKVEGNKLFVNGLYEEALSKYASALELVQDFPESIELRSICHLNRGVCFLKLVCPLFDYFSWSIEFRLRMSIVLKISMKCLSG